MDASGVLVDLTEAQRSAFGREPQILSHRLHEDELFGDASLTALIDSYPRAWLQAFTMGTDPERREDWAAVEVGDRSGAEVLEAVRRGRLWLNILNTQRADERFRAVLDGLYAGLARQCPGFRALTTSATLLVSSPRAQVYYHVDGPPNLLWHIRGEKRVLVYPAGDRRLLSQEIMEDVFAGAADEEMPYRAEWDEYAVAFAMRPGDAAGWPHNSPHRVQNGDSLNVSLSTNHTTAASEHRRDVYLANRFLRRRAHLPVRSVGERGPWPHLKVTAYRVCRRLGLDPGRPSYDYRATLAIDPDAPGGVSPLDRAVRTGFAG